MRNRFHVLILTFVLVAALLVACGGGSDDDQPTTPDSSQPPAPTATSDGNQTATPDSTKTPAPTATVDDEQTVKNAKAFFENPPQFKLDLDVEKAFDDFAVPEVRMDIPDIGMESLDFDLQFDPDVSIDDTLTVPSASSLLGDLPGFASGGSTVIPPAGSETPPAGWEPDEATCLQFMAAPSCSHPLIPPEVRDLCEQCKAAGY